MTGQKQKMKMKLHSSSAIFHVVKKLWFQCVLFVGLALASTALGEEGTLKIEKIECSGNTNSKCGFIVDQTTLKEGDILEDDKVRESKIRLQLAGYYRNADIQLDKGSQAGHVVVKITVEERSPYSYTLSAGFLDLNKHKYQGEKRGVSPILDVSGTSRNFTGRGDSLSLRARSENGNLGGSQGYWPESPRYPDWSSENLLRLEYVRPAFLLPRMYLVSGLGFGNYGRNTLRFGNRDRYQTWPSYTEQNFWGDVALGYKLFNYSFAAVGYRYFLHGRTHSNPFVQLGWDSQDNAHFPTQGSRLLLAFNWNRGVYGPRYSVRNGNSDFSFNFQQHWSPWENHVLSFRIGDSRGADPAFDMNEEFPTSVRYTRILKRTGDTEVKKTALYVEPSVQWWGKGHNLIPNVKIGSTIQTDYGIVNLFLVGATK